MNNTIINSTGWCYEKIIKKILFRYDPESVHEWATAIGERMGNSCLAKQNVRRIFQIRNQSLRQNLFRIDFENPIGLSAGFDYEGRLTGILPAMGFGFGSIGTLTDQPYNGNPRPMLGRLPRSRSLMVNKGFKNDGVAATLGRLKYNTFTYPVGVSVGKTNTLALKTQAEAVADVISAFRAAEASSVAFAYYELNISCPNLAGSVEFYEPDHLEELLAAIEREVFSNGTDEDHFARRPVFVKMPISKTDDEIRGMMDVIIRYPYIKAVIFGNLQRDRNDPAIVPEEAAQFPASIGNFSGKPCERRSDELIRLIYKEYVTPHRAAAEQSSAAHIKIIGCGGVFSAEDAYRKIRLGASLVQLITGLIFQGPQLIAQINRDLAAFLERDGFANVSEAVGKDAV